MHCNICPYFCHILSFLSFNFILLAFLDLFLRFILNNRLHDSQCIFMRKWYQSFNLSALLKIYNIIMKWNWGIKDFLWVLLRYKLLFKDFCNIFELYFVDKDGLKILQKSIFQSIFIGIILGNNKRNVEKIDFLISKSIVIVTIFNTTGQELSNLRS